MASAYDPAELRYTATHEWVHIDGGLATVGLTDFAQDQLSDIVWVDLPEVETLIEEGNLLATVESVKAAGDVYSPVSGKVAEVNEELTESPELVNQEPYASWFCRVLISETTGVTKLLTLSEYNATVNTG